MPQAVLTVRFKTTLPPEEVWPNVEKTLKDYEAVDGLVQKYYVAEKGVNDVVGGVYIFSSMEKLQAFLDSKLASTIPTDFKVSEIRKEVYNLLHVLRPEEKNSLVGNGAGI